MDNGNMTKEMADIEKRFTYHAPRVERDEVWQYQDISDYAKDLAVHFLNECPISRELSLALTKLEEAVFWANAAVARNE